MGEPFAIGSFHVMVTFSFALEVVTGVGGSAMNAHNKLSVTENAE